jgi:hypothetical protein
VDEAAVWLIADTHLDAIEECHQNRKSDLGGAMSRAAVESSVVIKTFERAEMLEAFAGNLPDPTQRAEQLRVAMDLISDLGPIRPVSVSKVLGLTEKTVRAWASEGALGIARTEPRVLLDPLSVHTVLHLVEGLRAAGQTRGLLDEVYRRLSDTSLIESKDLQESLGQMKQGQGEVVRARPSA